MAPTRSEIHALDALWNFGQTNQIVSQALYDLAYTVLLAGLFSPFFIMKGRGFFHASRHKLQGLAALYTVLFISISSFISQYEDQPLQLIVSTLTIGTVGFVTDWLVFARRKNERN